MNAREPPQRLFNENPDSLTELRRLQQNVLRDLDEAGLIDHRDGFFNGALKISEIMRIAQDQPLEKDAPVPIGYFSMGCLLTSSGRTFTQDVIETATRDLTYVMKRKLGKSPTLEEFSRHWAELADYYLRHSLRPRNPVQRILDKESSALTEREQLQQNVLRCLDKAGLIDHRSNHPRSNGALKISEIIRIAARQSLAENAPRLVDGPSISGLLTSSGQTFTRDVIDRATRDLTYVMETKLGENPNMKEFSERWAELAGYYLQLGPKKSGRHY